MSNSAPSSDAAGKQATGSWPRSLAGIVRKVFDITSWFRSSEDPSIHGQLPGQEHPTEPSVTDRAETRSNDPKESLDSAVRLESPSNVVDETTGSEIVTPGSERCVKRP
jgi:hypothetical protein